MRALVLGATGDQGLAQLEAARATGHEVIAAVRDPQRARRRLGPDVELRELDLDAPPSVATALCGVDVLFANFASSSFNDSERLLRQATAAACGARAAGVGLVLLNTSMPLRDRPIGHPAHDTRLAMVEAFAAAAVPLIVFNPVVFMGNLLRGWARPAIVERGVFEYPHAADLEVSWLCQEDLAGLMVAAATRPSLAGRRYAVGGPEVLRGAEVAQRLTEALGRPIRFVSQDVDDFCAAIAPQVTDGDAAMRARKLAELGRIYRWYNESPERPFRVDMAATLADLPVRLTTLREWAHRQRWEH
jgi:uncharacterized protein YbjT (DUF2867 family)